MTRRHVLTMARSSRRLPACLRRMKLRRREPSACFSSLGALRMHADPRFWALFAAIWVGLVLAIMNIVVKVNLLMDLTALQ
jgi:hypothetical protein